MKKKFYIKTAFLSLAAMALLSSCLKDSRYVDYGAVGTLIELPLAENGDQAGIGGPYQAPTYSLASGATDTLTVAVNVASPKPLGSPLSVTLSVSDLTTLNAFNSANGTNFQPLPSSDYSVIGGLTVTIPANQRLGYAHFLINAKAIGIDTLGKYVLPVTIASASGQTIAQPDKALLYNIFVTP
jgi:hypothetical protein